MTTNPTGIGQYDSQLYSKTFIYDFAVDGGAIGTIPLRSALGAIPSGAVILAVAVDLLTAFVAAAGATASFGIEADGDLQAAADPNTYTAGRIIATPYADTTKNAISAAAILANANGLTANMLLTTAARFPHLVVATHPLTAGKMLVNVQYALI